MGCHVVVPSDRFDRALHVSNPVDIIERGGVVLLPGSSDSDAVIGVLLDQLVSQGQLAADLREPALAAIREREELSSTVMVEISVSIPHARLDGVDGIVAALAAAPAALYQAMEGVPINIVVLVLSSPDLAGDHLNVLAGLSMMLQSQAVRDAIAAAQSAEEVIALLREQKARAGR